MPGNAARDAERKAGCDEAADDRDDLWSMAECIHHAFEGGRGCVGDITPFFQPLELMSDL